MLIIVVYTKEELLVKGVDEDIFRFIPCGVGAGEGSRNVKVIKSENSGSRTYSPCTSCVQALHAR